MKVTKLVIHHSASPKAKTRKEDIASWHKDNGFAEIGYHMVIETQGRKKDGRSTSKQGSHAKGANANSLGVCVCGNFESEMPEPKQIEALTEVLTDWCRTHKLNETNIFGHYNVPGGTTTTDCPGKNLKMKLPTIKTAVKNNLAK